MITGMAAMAAIALLVAGCGQSGDAGSPPPTEPAAIESELPTTTEPAVDERTATDEVTDDGAAAAFLAWLEASRIPEVDEACAGLSPDLVERMLAEMQQDGFPEVTTCEEMITLTADLYRAFDSGAEVDIDVQNESATDAILFVSYLDSGDCGTVVMERTGTEWIINDQTEECGV